MPRITEMFCFAVYEDDAHLPSLRKKQRDSTKLVQAMTRPRANHRPKLTT